MPSCPSGHDSTSTDFCDVCGLAIGGAAPTATAPTEATPSVPELPAELCPVCGEPRTGRFCEGCSYDFVAGASKAPVVNQAVAEPVAPIAPTPEQWSLLVTADREYFDAVRQQDGPDVPTITFPTYCPDREFTLAGQEVRIGRTSRSRGMVPEVDLTGPPQDPGVSHLHAVLLAQGDGGWAVVDPGSTNGTTINDDLEPIANDVAVPVKDGDRIHVGAWTTLTVRGPSIG
jgi:FHA domain-containing protein